MINNAFVGKVSRKPLKYVAVHTVLVAVLLGLASPVVATSLPVLAVSRIRLLGGGISDTFKGFLGDRPYALKPVRRIGAGPPSWRGQGQGNVEAEFICLALLGAVGLKTPSVFLFRPGPEAPAVLAVSWIDEGSVGTSVRIAGRFLDETSPRLIHRPSFARLFLVDILTGNGDRHESNFFVYQGADGLYRPIPIDHNLALLPDWKPWRESKAGLTVRAFAGLTRHCGRLAAEGDWGDVVSKELDTVLERLSPSFLDEVVDGLPAIVPQGRLAFLRRYLAFRRAGLRRGVRQWRTEHLAPAAPPSAPAPSATITLEVARARFQSRRAKRSRFAGLLRRLVPNAEHSALQAALVEVLAAYGRSGLMVTGGRACPPSLALGLRVLSDGMGAELRRERFWATLYAEADWARNPPYLVGWGGPVAVNDPHLGTRSLQQAGFGPHAAARILFERLANGPYRSRNDLVSRNLASDVVGRIVVPEARQTPPLPSLVEAKGLVDVGIRLDVTLPPGALHLVREKDRVAVTVRLRGLRPLPLPAIPIVGAGEALPSWVKRRL